MILNHLGFLWRELEKHSQAPYPPSNVSIANFFAILLRQNKLSFHDGIETNQSKDRLRTEEFYELYGKKKYAECVTRYLKDRCSAQRP